MSTSKCCNSCGTACWSDPAAMIHLPPKTSPSRKKLLFALVLPTMLGDLRPALLRGLPQGAAAQRRAGEFGFGTTFIGNAAGDPRPAHRLRRRLGHDQHEPQCGFRQRCADGWRAPPPPPAAPPIAAPTAFKAAGGRRRRQRRRIEHLLDDRQSVAEIVARPRHRRPRRRMPPRCSGRHLGIAQGLHLEKRVVDVGVSDRTGRCRRLGQVLPKARLDDISPQLLNARSLAGGCDKLLHGRRSTWTEDRRHRLPPRPPCRRSGLQLQLIADPRAPAEGSAGQMHTHGAVGGCADLARQVRIEASVCNSSAACSIPGPAGLALGGGPPAPPRTPTSHRR